MKNIVMLAALTFSSSLAFAHQLPTGTTWRSDYIVGKGQFTLKVLNQEDVSVTEDRNSCGIDVFGNVAFCTMMYYPPTEGTLILNQVSVPSTTLLYELTGSNYQVVHNFTEEALGTLRLLKMNENGNITDIVRLLKKN